MEILALYEIVSTAELSGSVNFYGERAYRFLKLADATNWVGLWILRLSISGVIHRTLSARMVMKSFDPEFLQVRRVEALQRARDTLLDILGGVPFLLELSTTPSSSARLLTWPISIVASPATASPAAKTFALERLDFIRHTHSLVQATETVSIIREKNDLDNCYFT
ncbi:hypothetical protein F5Y16DRAFT_246760 [Xylariaceae sp. FL0255]|nr:hypothetical protein F5Y16DRAFT_246760 [Xylariaceae sp. FL0255]